MIENPNYELETTQKLLNQAWKVFSESSTELELQERLNHLMYARADVLNQTLNNNTLTDPERSRYRREFNTIDAACSQDPKLREQAIRDWLTSYPDPITIPENFTGSFVTQCNQKVWDVIDSLGFVDSQPREILLIFRPKYTGD